MKVCPACRRPLIVTTADEMVAIMKSHWPHRDVYLGAKGGYFMSHAGGQVTREAISAAEAAGMIVPKWPDRPSLKCWRVAEMSL